MGGSKSAISVANRMKTFRPGLLHASKSQSCAVAYAISAHGQL